MTGVYIFGYMIFFDYMKSVTGKHETPLANIRMPSENIGNTIENRRYQWDDVASSLHAVALTLITPPSGQVNIQK